MEVLTVVVFSTVNINICFLSDSHLEENQA